MKEFLELTEETEIIEKKELEDNTSDLLKEKSDDLKEEQDDKTE